MAEQKLCSSSVFRRVHKIAKIDCKLRHVHLSIRLSVCPHRTTRFPRISCQEILHLKFFENHSFFYPTVTPIVHKLINRLYTSRKFTITAMVSRGAKIYLPFIMVIGICATTV